jgi:hypothetical protein
LVTAVLVCAGGAAAALLAARATWVVEVTSRPAPFPAERTGVTGGSRQPWVPALAWVALAGAGALLATRAAVRRAVGVLLAVAGVGIAVAAGVAGGDSVLAPAAAAGGGLAVAVAGALAVARGHRWPAMGSRYQRRVSSRVPGDGSPGQLWDALDRGEDPTR